MIAAFFKKASAVFLVCALLGCSPKSQEMNRVAPATPEERKALEASEVWMRGVARDMIKKYTAVADDGVTVCFKPGVGETYNAMWTRDLWYMVSGFPEAFKDEELKGAILYLLKEVREDGVVPDRKTLGGVVYYSAGSGWDLFGEPPTDNGSFMVKLIDFYVNRSGDTDFFKTHVETLEKIMASIPRSAEGLIYIDPNGPPRSPYGFTDAVGKKGAELFSSILFWEASQAMARLYEKTDRAADGARWNTEADRVRSGLTLLWNDKEGIFMAASEVCRQADVWGSAYAVVSGIATEDEADAIARWLEKYFNLIVWHGMVRHIREPGGWERMLQQYFPDTYQNGGYWPMATPWVMQALRRADPTLSRKMIVELLAHMYKYGVHEWVNPEMLSGGPEYIASAVSALAAIHQELALLNPNGRDG